MKKFKTFSKKFILIFISVFLIVVTANSLYNYITADQIGEKLGEYTGKLAGTAVGSFQGITEGLASGADAGAEAGLNSNDVTMDIKNAMVSIGALEVLIADTKLYDVHTVGKTYKAVYELSGTAVFTLDLSSVTILVDDSKNSITAIIPQPKFNFLSDETQTKPLVKTEAFSLQTDASDGAKSYNKSADWLKAHAKDYLINYDSLNETAKDAAKTQTANLIRAIVGNDKIVYVYFR